MVLTPTTPIGVTPGGRYVYSKTRALCHLDRERSVIYHATRPLIRLCSLGLFICLALLGPTDEARSEWMIGIHGGTSDTRPNDVHLVEPGGTDLLIRNVHWFSMSFGSPPYYGLRLVRWFSTESSWGVGVDFTHTMMIARLKDSVDVSGTAAGLPRSGREQLWSTFANLQFSNGHSIASASVFYRRPPGSGNISGFVDRLRPYAGVGVGLATPHVEVETSASRTSSYQIGGIAAVVNAGTLYDVGKSVSLLFEYRLSRANIKAGLEGGGSLSLVSWTHHLHLGMVFVL